MGFESESPTIFTWVDESRYSLLGETGVIQTPPAIELVECIGIKWTAKNTIVTAVDNTATANPHV